MGEFRPILLITIILSGHNPFLEGLLLMTFVALGVVLAVVSVRSAWRGWPLLERTLESSSQLAVRLAVVLVFGLVAVANDLGLDVLLGGFMAGIVTRLALRGRELTVLESKLTAVGFGFLIPFFFVTSGMNFDLDALFADLETMLKLPLFLGLMLIVRGTPAMLLYRGVLEARDRVALSFFMATQLPLVVAITTIAVDGGHMHAGTAAALVGAAMLSTLIFPLVGLSLRRGRPDAEPEPAPA